MSAPFDMNDRLAAEARSAKLRKLARIDGDPGSQAAHAAAPDGAPGRMPRWAKLLLGLQACALLYFGVDAWQQSALRQDSARSTGAKPASPVARGAGPQKLESSGFVTASRIATVSSQVMGQVTEMAARTGAQVRKGELLAKISDRQALIELQLVQAQRVLAQARVQTAESQWHEAQRALDRETALQKQHFSSEARVSKLRSDEEMAQAAVKSAMAELVVAELQIKRQQDLLAEYMVRAPFDGLIVALNAQVGEIVAPSAAGGGYTRTGICTIVDMTSREIAIDVNEELITRVKPGQDVEAELYAYKGWRFPAKVVRLMPTADRSKATVRVLIRPLTDDPRILPEMTVKVFFL
jgi:RND family efflux transporter MFP subunit